MSYLCRERLKNCLHALAAHALFSYSEVYTSEVGYKFRLYASDHAGDSRVQLGG